MFEFLPYRLPLSIPYHWAKGVHHHRAGLIVRCDLDGAVGWGEAAPAPHRTVDRSGYPAEGRALVTGLDPRAPDFLQRLDGRAPPGRLRCGISTAWLSARAAQAGRTLAAQLAGAGEQPARRVPVNALVGDENPAKAAETAARLVAAGFRTLKVKCFADGARDLARIRAIREIAPGIRLRLDANEGWPKDWSLALLEAMARFDIEYVEQPLPRHASIADFVELKRASPIPVAIDESARDLASIRPFLDAGAVDILILKPPRVGGPDAVLAIAREAARYGVSSTVTASLETSVGLYAALHAAALLPRPIPDCGLGTAHFLAEDVAPPPPLVNGYMDLPGEPGLGPAGVEVRWAEDDPPSACSAV
jgi:o-succinylbenzoate synthase